MLKNKKSLLIGSAGLLTVLIVSGNAFLSKFDSSLSTSGLAQVVGSTKEAKPKPLAAQPAEQKKDSKPAAPVPGPAPLKPAAPAKPLASGDCDPVATLKTAIDMLKNSCYDANFINNAIGSLDTSTLSGETWGSEFMGNRMHGTTSVFLTDNLEIQMGQAGKRNRGETDFDTGNTRNKRTKTGPANSDNPNGNIIIPINLADGVSCDPEKMKGILFHELVHEKQFRSTNLGIWNSNGTHTQPIAKNGEGSNSINPRAMVMDCMEVEANVLTARCMQKEMLNPDYNKYKKSMDEILNDSKRQAKNFMNQGPPGGDAYRKGCMTYIKNLTKNLKPNGETVKSPDWLSHNDTILKNYMNNWIKKMKDLGPIIYEKLYEDPKDGGTKGDGEFKKFIKDTFGAGADEAQKMIDTWKLIKQQEVSNPQSASNSCLIPKMVTSGNRNNNQFSITTVPLTPPNTTPTVFPVRTDAAGNTSQFPGTPATKDTTAPQMTTNFTTPTETINSFEMDVTTRSFNTSGLSCAQTVITPVAPTSPLPTPPPSTPPSRRTTTPLENTSPLPTNRVFLPLTPMTTLSTPIR